MAAVVDIPVLCKDFILDEKQIVRARNAGATMILLIVSALSFIQLNKLYKKAQELDLEIIVEVHNESELALAEKLGARIIGINNRNLQTFVVDIVVSEDLALKQTSSSTVYISESGFKTVRDVQRIKKAYQAILVGEILMHEEVPNKVVEKLRILR